MEYLLLDFAIFFRAFNDALLLQNGAHDLVRHNFKGGKSYPMLTDTMLEVFRVLNIGRAIMLRYDLWLETVICHGV